jgi:hypothetical protein
MGVKKNDIQQENQDTGISLILKKGRTLRIRDRIDTGSFAMIGYRFNPIAIRVGAGKRQDWRYRLQRIRNFKKSPGKVNYIQIIPSFTFLQVLSYSGHDS